MARFNVGMEYGRKIVIDISVEMLEKNVVVCLVYRDLYLSMVEKLSLKTVMVVRELICLFRYLT
jgi:hypothetical protein